MKSFLNSLAISIFVTDNKRGYIYYMIWDLIFKLIKNYIILLYIFGMQGKISGTLS